MRVIVRRYSEDQANVLAAFTSAKECKVSNKRWFASEHSPIRGFQYAVEMYDIPTFVSVHFVRHKIGVEHFVKSNRDDRGGTGQEDRNTPVNHAMLLNAQTLILMARKRLCYKAHSKTVSVMTLIRKAVRESHEDLYPFLVPECVYRNGLCPEFSECKPGLTNVCKAYNLDEYRRNFKVMK